MPDSIKHYISPRYTAEKLESPSYSDIVDVFEDRMLNWLIEPAHKLASIDHGAIAAVGVLLSYFEGIEIYYSGEDSLTRSKEFFGRGFRRVFPKFTGPPEMFDSVIAALYNQARCGFAHDGLFRNRVFFSTMKSEALNVTWPKTDGEFDRSGTLESVVINPDRFGISVRFHFDRYVDLLRGETDAQTMKNFLAAIQLKWGLDEPDRVVGLSEKEFLGKA